MQTPSFLLIWPWLINLAFLSIPIYSQLPSANHEPSSTTTYKLSKPLIGDDGRVYFCSDHTFFAFESNGTIAWSMHLNYECDLNMAPVHGGSGKIYLVAEHRVLKIEFHKNGASERGAELFFGQKVLDEIIGVSVSTSSSIVFITVKTRGLFAYTTNGDLLWSAGPVLYKFDYRQGCRKNMSACYFTSPPLLDPCEASVYISNTEGELYSLSMRSPHFKWIRDFSSWDKYFTITPGNNGHLYITIPARTILLALDVFSGNILWQRDIGPLSKADCAPVVDSNGWVSIGSLDGFLYSISPTGDLKKFSRRDVRDFVIQVAPVLDCSGYAVYISQTEMETKVSRTIDQSNYISALQPKAAIFTMLVPATGSIYWSETYSSQSSSPLLENILSQFIVDEEILLAFIAASRTRTPLQCRSTGTKIASSCSEARAKSVSIYTGNERAILLFLLLESAVLALLVGLVRFCCSFWKKKKLQGKGLASFLEKRCILWRKKKELDRTITELEKKAADDAVGEEVFQKLGDVVSERKCIERKLSTTYSLGRDGISSKSKPLLPLLKGQARSFSFHQGTQKSDVAEFDALNHNTSSGEDESESETDIEYVHEGLSSMAKGKEKARIEYDSSTSSDDVFYNGSSSEPSSSSKGCVSSHGEEAYGEIQLCDEEGSEGVVSTVSRTWLKRRRTLSFTSY